MMTVISFTYRESFTVFQDLYRNFANVFDKTNFGIKIKFLSGISGLSNSNKCFQSSKAIDESFTTQKFRNGEKIESPELV